MAAHRALRLWLVCSLVAACGALLLLAPTRAVAAELDRAEVERLTTEGTDWFQRAGDTDLSRAERNDALVKAYERLKKASALLDAYCNDNPSAIESLDAEMVQLNMKLFWIKKESPLGLLDGRRPPADGTPPGKSPGPPSGPPPREPAPPGGGGATPPAAPSAPSQEPETPPRPAIEVAREHERLRPHDLGGALELWLDVLVEVGDVAAVAYQEALERVAVLSERLKEGYRALRNDDPDSIAGGDTAGRESDVAARLATGLGAAEPAERARAADQLAALGHTPAASSIQDALRREKDAAVRERMFLALVRLGGRRTCETLARFAKEQRPELPLGAVGALAALGKKGPVQARYACLSLGEFTAVSRQLDAATAALAALESFGAPAVDGLVRAAQTKDKALELRVLEALGATGHPRAAPTLCERLETSGDGELRAAATAALSKIGRPAVPALIDALRTRKTRQYAGSVLYELTGQAFGEDVRAWTEWWRTQEK